MKMLKRSFVVLFGVVAIVAILAATELVAQTPEPCPPDTPDCVPFDGFNVWVVREDGLFPKLDGVTGDPVYTYRVDCVSRKVNYIDIIIPKDVILGDSQTGIWPYKNIETFYKVGDADWLPAQYWLFPEGVGDDGFGKNINIYYVLKWKIMQFPTFWFSVKIKGQGQKLGANQIAMLLKTGIGPKPGVILGPSLPLPSQPGYIPLTVEDSKDFGPYPVKILRDPATWCATDVFEWTTDPEKCPSSPCWVKRPPEDYSQALIHCGTPDGNQRCAECVIFGSASPGCYTYTSGGVTYKIPKGCK